MSISNCWQTPWEFFDVVNREYKFTIDVAAAHENAKASLYLTKEEDALRSDRSWGNRGDRAWCNPPFDKPGPWCEKAYQQMHDNGVTTVLLLPLLCAPWMEFCYERATKILDIYPRIQFVPPPGVKKSSNAKDNVLVVFEAKFIWGEPLIRRYWRWK